MNEAERAERCLRVSEMIRRVELELAEVAASDAALLQSLRKMKREPLTMKGLDFAPRVGAAVLAMIRARDALIDLSERAVTVDKMLKRADALWGNDKKLSSEQAVNAACLLWWSP